MTRDSEEVAPLLERGCAPVYFVNGIGQIRTMPGGNFMLTFFRHDRHSREVELKIVMAKCDLEIMLRAADGAVQGIPVIEPKTMLMM
jgi:hypothetical protein